MEIWRMYVFWNSIIGIIIKNIVGASDIKIRPKLFLEYSNVSSDIQKKYSRVTSRYTQLNRNYGVYFCFVRSKLFSKNISTSFDALLNL